MREKEKHQELLVFISNLPLNLNLYRLRGIFQRAAKVNHSYIPARRSPRNHPKFGYVGFEE